MKNRDHQKRSRSEFIEIHQTFNNCQYHKGDIITYGTSSYGTGSYRHPIKHIPKPDIQRFKSLPQSHTPTPMPYSPPSQSDDSGDSDNIQIKINHHHNNNKNNRKHNGHKHINQQNNVSKFGGAPNQIPFIQEDLSPHTMNSVSSYPSILALKLSFTNQASNDAISILSPNIPQQLNVNHDKNKRTINIIHTTDPNICNNNDNNNNNNKKNDNNSKPNIKLGENDNDGDHVNDINHSPSSDSSFYNNSEDDDNINNNNINKKKNKDVILNINREQRAHSYQIIDQSMKKGKKLKSKKKHAMKTKINGMAMSLDKASTLDNHHIHNKNTKNNKSNRNDKNKKNKNKNNDNNNNNEISPKSTLSPKGIINGIGLLSRTDGSSLLDHEDAFDPPQPSLHYSTVSTPTAIQTQYGPSTTRKSKSTISIINPNISNKTLSNKTLSTTPKDGDIITGGIDTLLSSKVPRNSQYAPYATMLQSVVEEVSDQSSLEQDDQKNNIDDNDNNNNDKIDDKLPNKNTMLIGKHSDTSIEYHAYKRRREEFNKIINHNRKQIKHNTNSIHMNLKSMNVNIDNIQQNQQKRSSSNDDIGRNQNRNNDKKKKNKSSYYNSSSVVIVPNKIKRHRNHTVDIRHNVDIRRPQTTRRHKYDDIGLFRYDLNSDNMTDTVSKGTSSASSSSSSCSSSSSSFTTLTKSETSDDDDYNIIINNNHNNNNHYNNNINNNNNVIKISMDRSLSTIDSPSKYYHYYHHHRNNYHQPHRNNNNNNNNHQHNRYINNNNNNNKHNGYNNNRRPVRIIRRAKDVKNNNVYDNNHHHHRKSKKYGLFDEYDDDNKSGKPSDLSEWELIERDKFFLESKYRSYDESDISIKNKNNNNNNNRGGILNIDDKLTCLNNDNHIVCKKEIHDAYERGFLAGYFLGVNIMQQQQKEKDNNKSIVAK